MFESFDTGGRIVVVDSDPSSYGAILDAAARWQVSICFLPSGRAALRLPRQADDRLWIVNAQLPDISGFELLAVLQERSNRVRVIVVGDSYQVADELRACRSGAACYLCKPVDLTPLSFWGGEARSAKATQDGPGRGGTVCG